MPDPASVPKSPQSATSPRDTPRRVGACPENIGCGAIGDICLEYAALGQRVLLRDKKRCRVCVAPADHVHHSRYNHAASECPRLVDERFCLAVCTQCHALFHCVRRALAARRHVEDGQLRLF